MTSASQLVSIALAGDVMIGRGVDQIMRHPGDPTLYETYVHSAVRYVELAEEKSGSIPRSVSPSYVWGDTPSRLDRLGVDLRVVNLETAITTRGRPWSRKGIHYRAHPDNADCLLEGGIDVVNVANNHILDWSEPGMEETLERLDCLGVARTGAGADVGEAWQPATVPTEHSNRVVVLGLGSPSSGVDPAWAAGTNRPGVAFLGGLSESWVDRVNRALVQVREAGDIVVVSIHWGPNWGYGIPGSHRRFARSLIDRAGVDVVHGHSSHHAMGIEIYRERLIIYGSGDLLTDYEGISGHEEYRPELGAWYVVTLNSETGAMKHLRLVPTKMHRFQLITPNEEETGWLARRIEAHSPTLEVEPRDDFLVVDW